jgi:Fe-Mn family superoxide dismutase
MIHPVAALLLFVGLLFIGHYSLSSSPSSSSSVPSLSSTMSTPQMETKKSEQLLVLPPLPWPKDALEPHISKKLMEYHYEKHHRGYVDGLNKMASEDPKLGIQGQSFDELIRKLPPGKAFNFAGQAWNHAFYWHSMAPAKRGGGGEPTGNLMEAITQTWGTFDKFKTEFSEIAAGHFGSGWAWLVQTPDGKLRVEQTHDGGNVIREGKGKPLLACDVWEHAYYLDRQNDRKAYIEQWWSLVNWKFANDNLASDCIGLHGPCEGDEHSTHVQGQQVASL